MSRSFRPRNVLFVCSSLLACLVAAHVAAQDDIDSPPINYATTETRDAVAQLKDQLDRGEVTLQWDEQHGWLPSVLKLLDVPLTSQTLVFSKTSLQTAKISPRRPRALYFGDDVYVGAVQYGDLIELSAVDPHQGATFYSLDAEYSEKPRLRRTSNACLACHESARTQQVPGYLVRSVYPSKSGHPHFELGTTTTDQTSAFHERFGGWYVTGRHGELRHRGNVIADKEAKPPLDMDAGANVTELASRLKVDRYLTPHSDLVALMVLEHQAQMHNFITRANYEGRRATHYDATWNKLFERPEGTQSDVSKRRIASAGEKLLQYLLFSDEFVLTSPVSGTSDFAAEFQARGPRDSQGRSLRDFDLQTRMFKYPCSYLIYSDSFAALPDNIRAYVDRRLREILNDEDQSPAFKHLSSSDRQAIHEILTDTLPTYP